MNVFVIFPNKLRGIGESFFLKLNYAKNDGCYYTSMNGNILIRGKLAYVINRFGRIPLATIIHYASYLKLAHLKKIFG